jgi:hypothetical protein
MGMMTGLLLLAACGDKAETPVAAGATADRPIPLETLAAGPSDTPSGDCSGSRIGEPLVLTFGKNSIKQLGGPQQEIERNVTRKGSNTKDPPVIAGNVLYPTNLDLQANSLGTAMGPKDYVEIQIKLDSPDQGNKDLIFLRSSAGIVPGNNDDPVAAVTVREGARDHFCFLGKIERAGDIETVRLGSKLLAGEQSSINIGVQIANYKNAKYSTPIYIDPNVRNEG